MKKSILVFITSLISGAAMTIAADSPSGTTNIRIDGSSTVYVLTEAVAEEFQKGNRDARVTVGISGTGGGMKRFTNGEIDIANASRSIESGEIAKAKANNINFTEFKIAYDGIVIAVNKSNTFAKSLTTAELKKIWEAGSTVKKWSDIRKEFPNENIKLYGPGADSGTFDYFTKVINGKEKSIRSDFVSSENDDVLVKGVAGDKFAMGYFGYAYYEENKSRLNLVAVSHDGKVALTPNPANIKDGTYKPLARPLYIYVNNKSLVQTRVKDFVQFYLKNAGSLAPQVGYVALDSKMYSDQISKLVK